jgi:nucleoside-triphosphatase
MRVLSKRLLFLTGNPGVGKTTVLLRIVEALQAKGYSVGGMVSREVRDCRGRIGFEVLDLAGDKRGWLAHVNQKIGPRIGRYRVNVEDLESVGVSAIVGAIESSDVIVIDEIGPMELFSEKFKKAVKKAMESKNLVVGVVHWKARDKLIDEVESRQDAEVYVVTFESRENLHEVVCGKALEFLREA